MKCQYYILSTADDFYMADAICRELGKAGKNCYYNLRDSKKEGKMPDAYDRIGSDTSILAIVNEAFMSNRRLVSPVSFYSKTTTPDKVFVIRNDIFYGYPAEWIGFKALDATDGLNKEMMAVIEGEASAMDVITVADVAQTEPQPSAQTQDETPVFCCRVGNPVITDLIGMEEGMAPTLQRAVRYMTGDGVPEDEERAFSLFKKAAQEDPDDRLALYYWGVCNELEYGGGKPEDAVAAYEKSLELGFGPALVRLAMARYAVKDYQEARDLLSGMASDDAEALYCRGLIDEAEEKYEDAVENYSMAAEQGHVAAQNALGCLYEEGKGVRQDETKALRWFALASDGGLTEGMVNVGIRLVGNPDEEIRNTAWTLLQEAAARGNQIAADVIHEIEEIRMAEEREQEMERKRQEEAHRRKVENSAALDAFLSGLNLPGIVNYAKGKLLD